MTNTTAAGSFDASSSNEVQLVRAWRVAQNIAFQRENQALSDRLQSITTERDRVIGELHKLENELRHARALLNNVITQPRAQVPANLQSIAQEARKLEGNIKGSKNVLSLKTLDAGSFFLLGRLVDQSGRPGASREALLSFQFFDDGGHPIAAPEWTRQSETYGAYRYITPDENGWFDRLITFPPNTAHISIAAHDFRRQLKEYQGMTLVPLQLKSITTTSNELVSPHFITQAGDDLAPTFAKEGAIVLDQTGVSTLLNFATPVKSAQFQVKAGIFEHANGRLVIETETRTGDTNKKIRQEVEIDGKNTVFGASIYREEPFSQVIVHLRAKHKSRPILLRDRQLRNLGTYPNTDAFKSLMADSVPLTTLNAMADDWDNRGKWYCVQDDLKSYETPLIIVKRLGADARPHSLNFAACAAPGVPADRKGIVVSLSYFDNEGKRLQLSDPAFGHSAAVGNFAYVPSYGHLQNHIARLPMVDNAAYMSVAVQGWKTREFNLIKAAPLLEPTDEIGRGFEETMLEPNRDSSQSWHGLYARVGPKDWVTLLPNFWETTMNSGVAELAIRLGEGADQSLWRDLVEPLWSPDIKKLRTIIVKAQKLKVPITLHLERMAPKTPIPFQLVSAADYVVASEAQAHRLRDIVDPKNIIIDNGALGND